MPDDRIRHAEFRVQFVICDVILIRFMVQKVVKILAYQSQSHRAFIVTARNHGMFGFGSVKFSWQEF